MDARLDIGLPGHPKTKKLIKRLGESAAWGLVRLILWARQHRPTGDLSGISDEDLEIAIDWHGENTLLIRTLADVGFLEGEEGNRCLHDWHEHQPWASGEKERSDASRWAAYVKHNGIEAAKQKFPEYYAAHKNRCDSAADRTKKAAPRSVPQESAANSAAPSPLPLPLPSPIPKEEREREPARGAPLSLEEAQEWATRFSQGNTEALVIEPASVWSWFNSRQSMGWVLVSSGVEIPISDWQADLRFWARRDNERRRGLRPSKSQQPALATSEAPLPAKKDGPRLADPDGWLTAWAACCADEVPPPRLGDADPELQRRVRLWLHERAQAQKEKATP